MKKIEEIEDENNKSSRRIQNSDINSIENGKNIAIKEDKLKKYRIQIEYGEKKFIKP
tara:strand:- start:4349 stop:4519 length:171 start_codon:yes stop_codon:yes gene_type:complete